MNYFTVFVLVFLVLLLILLVSKRRQAKNATDLKALNQRLIDFKQKFEQAFLRADARFCIEMLVDFIAEDIKSSMRDNKSILCFLSVRIVIDSCNSQLEFLEKGLKILSPQTKSIQKE